LIEQLENENNYVIYKMPVAMLKEIFGFLSAKHRDQMI